MIDVLILEQLSKSLNKTNNATLPNGIKLALSQEALKDIDLLAFEDWKKDNPDADIVYLET